MTTPPITENDILRFCVELCRARDNEDQVKAVIDRHLASLSTGLHSAYLKVTLRVIVAQFFGLTARKLDHELGWESVDAGLALQAAANGGLLDEDDDPEVPRPRHLAIVTDS
ncbi:hypothetical protein ACWEN6_25110 [Sphaerisporangium sp. NPDC004334]